MLTVRCAAGSSSGLKHLSYAAHAAADGLSHGVSVMGSMVNLGVSKQPARSQAAGCRAVQLSQRLHLCEKDASVLGVCMIGVALDVLCAIVHACTRVLLRV